MWYGARSPCRRRVPPAIASCSCCSSPLPPVSSRHPAEAAKRPFAVWNSSASVGIGAVTHAGDPRCRGPVTRPPLVTRHLAARQANRQTSDGNPTTRTVAGRPGTGTRPRTACSPNAPGYFWNRHPTPMSSRSSGPTCCTGYSADLNSSRCCSAEPTSAVAARNPPSSSTSIANSPRPLRGGQPAAAAGGLKHRRVVDDPVHDRSGGHRIEEDLGPACGRQVRRHHEAVALVALADEAEQQVGGTLA